MSDSGELTKENFIKLLAKTSPEVDSEAGSLAYLRLHNSLVRFFRLKGDILPEAAADLTLDRVAEKNAAGAEISDIKQFSFGVARLVFYERLRTEAKTKKAAQEFEKQRQPDVIIAENTDFTILRECFKALPVAEREVLQTYFAESVNQKTWRENLAESLNISLDNLRVRIFRLRKRLEKCVAEKLK